VEIIVKKRAEIRAERSILELENDKLDELRAAVQAKRVIIEQKHKQCKEKKDNYKFTLEELQADSIKCEAIKKELDEFQKELEEEEDKLEEKRLQLEEEAEILADMNEQLREKKKGSWKDRRRSWMLKLLLEGGIRRVIFKGKLGVLKLDVYRLCK